MSTICMRWIFCKSYSSGKNCKKLFFENLKFAFLENYRSNLKCFYTIRKAMKFCIGTVHGFLSGGNNKGVIRKNAFFSAILARKSFRALNPWLRCRILRPFFWCKDFLNRTYSFREKTIFNFPKKVFCNYFRNYQSYRKSTS